jgi:hypothetical protein
MRSHQKTIQDLIQKQFEWCGFFLTDQDGDVENIEVQGIELGDILLIKVDDCRATFEVDAQITYSADVSYADMDTAISDEGELIPWRTIHNSVERTVEVPAEILLEFDPSKPEDVGFQCLKINNGQDIEVEADEDDWDLR